MYEFFISPQLLNREQNSHCCCSQICCFYSLSYQNRLLACAWNCADIILGCLESAHVLMLIQKMDFVSGAYQLKSLSPKDCESDFYMHENIQLYGLIYEWNCLSRHLWYAVIANGTFWDPKWKRSPPGFLMEGFSLLFLNQAVLPVLLHVKNLKALDSSSTSFYGFPHRTGMMTAAPSISNLVAVLYGSWHRQVISCKLDLFLNKQSLTWHFSIYFCPWVVNSSLHPPDRGQLADSSLELFLPSGFDLNHPLMKEMNILWTREW